MTTGNIGTTVLSLAAVSLLFFLAPYAVADEGGESDITPIRMFDPKGQYDKIPDDVLLDRIDSEWTAQNASDPKFKGKQDAIKMYVAYDNEKNG